MRSKLIIAIIAGGIIGSLIILSLMYFFEKPSSKNKGLQLISKDSTDSQHKNQQILVYGNYMNLDSTNFLLIPLGMKTMEKPSDGGLRSKSSDEYESSVYNDNYRNFKYNFYSLNFNNCNNIIFYNKINDETHLLLKVPAIISQFYFPYYDSEYKGKKYWFILMAIREYDTNADGYINEQDAEKVYISDLSGKYRTAITPDETQLVDWFIDEATNTVLMKVRFDSNDDKKFDYADELEILKTSITSPEIGKMIISKEIKNDIYKILNKIQ